MKAAAAGTLSVLTPVAESEVEALRDDLASLPEGAESPLARVAGTHIARWSVVPCLHGKDEHEIDATAYLLFTSWFDGPAEAYPEALLAGMAAEAHAIWRHCSGYPGIWNALAFRRYLLDHRLTPGLALGGYPGATVDEVLSALELRESIAAFAVDSQGMGANQLRNAWQERFPLP